MKVYISVDIEGISNIVASYQIVSADGGGSIQETREVATREVNASIEGACAAGATEVVVNENHSGAEMIPELLDKRAVLLSGQGKFLETAHGIEGFDTLFLVGIHPRMGSPDGVLEHTWIPKVFREFRVNDKPIGEIGLNALMAGHYDVPTSLVTGCKVACEEAIDLLTEVETVAVKEGVGRYAAYCPHPKLNREKVRQGAEQAVKDLSRFRPLKMDTPYRLEWDFCNQQQAMRVCLIQGAERLSPRTVRFEVPDFYEGMKLFSVVSIVGDSATDPTMG
jgi:D-amino peptidase